VVAAQASSDCILPSAALFWFFGPLILLITTILVVLFLAFTDEISLKDFSHITAAEKVSCLDDGQWMFWWSWLTSIV
jgi:hypothetical protein